MTTYAADTADDREVLNPAVKAATAELKRLRTTAQKLRAALGRILVLDTDQPRPAADRPSSKSRRSPHVPPTTRAALISQLQTLEVQIEGTKSQLRNLPPHVPLSSLGPLPQVPRLERKLITDMVKIAAYNAQSWLADRLARHYANTNDLHDLLRSFGELSGTLIRQADGGLKVCLEPPDLPLHRRVLAGLCADLNLGQPVFPGTELPVHYEVADAKSTATRHDNHWCQTNWSDAPLFQVRNHHSADCGIPPHIDDRSPSQYLGYFENQHGEQAVFVYDRGSSQAILYLGDAGWDTPYTVVDGAVSDLVLSVSERLWVRACWQVATANTKEA